MNCNSLVLLVVSPARENKQQVHWSKFYQRKDFPSPLSFRDAPERSCSATAAHFWVPRYHEEAPIIDPLLFSPLFTENSPWNCWYGLQKWRNCSTSGTQGIWVTSLCISWFQYLFKLDPIYTTSIGWWDPTV